MFSSLAIALYFIFNFQLRKHKAKKLYKSSPSYHGSISLDVTEERLHFKGESYDSNIAWGHFVKYVEDEKMVLLYANELVFHMVPKRNFSPEQLASFCGLLARKVNNSTQSRQAAAGRG